jgi:hypothetical protein
VSGLLIFITFDDRINGYGSALRRGTVPWNETEVQEETSCRGFGGVPPISGNSLEFGDHRGLTISF